MNKFIRNSAGRIIGSLSLVLLLVAAPGPLGRPAAAGDGGPINLGPTNPGPRNLAQLMNIYAPRIVSPFQALAEQLSTGSNDYPVAKLPAPDPGLSVAYGERPDGTVYAVAVQRVEGGDPVSLAGLNAAQAAQQAGLKKRWDAQNASAAEGPPSAERSSELAARRLGLTFQAAQGKVTFGEIQFDGRKKDAGDVPHSGSH